MAFRTEQKMSGYAGASGSRAPLDRSSSVPLDRMSNSRVKAIGKRASRRLVLPWGLCGVTRRLATASCSTASRAHVGEW